MKGESNATASNCFTQPCWNAGGRAAFSLLTHLCSYCTSVCHSKQLHATHLLFAWTNEFEQAAGKDPVYNPDDC